MNNQKPNSKPEDAEQPRGEGLSSSILLAAVDALRGALGDNPLVLVSGYTRDGLPETCKHFLSDPELEAALCAVIPHLPPRCPNCEGHGWMFSNQTRNREKCRRCEGSGFVSANR
jgi:hypothetical protein